MSKLNCRVCGLDTSTKESFHLKGNLDFCCLTHLIDFVESHVVGTTIRLPKVEYFEYSCQRCNKEVDFSKGGFQCGGNSKGLFSWCSENCYQIFNRINKKEELK